jgi:hypothetical protein
MLPATFLRGLNFNGWDESREDVNRGAEADSFNLHKILCSISIGISMSIQQQHCRDSNYDIHLFFLNGTHDSQISQC